ncbi:LysR family transcriptional regulator [Shewanella surugensis]|uniref:LysR family transcriptional regulator n=1 Tax=Shewanella surugensis TaxID=212020 RepID=A0ABT0LBQ0_9GAMM|nr:LysR family transcriptional regulator [Shewanella surugensis]MCL1125099.1 LysR family transcriptional regulator [Shewanella surugensis]
MNVFSAIPVFVAIVETGSFSKAAERLNSSKSAVSKRITQLETALGIRLLHRTTRSLSLTQAGQIYFDSVNEALTLANNARDAINQHQIEIQGHLRINAPMAFGRLHLAPLISTFLKKHSKVSIEMIMDDKVLDMIEHRFDLAIRIGKLPDSSLIARKLAPCDSVLCASPDYLQQHGIPDSPQALKAHNCLVYSYFQAGSEWQFNSNKGVISVQPKGNYRVNNSEALYQALLDGLGICQMPIFIVNDALKTGKLVPLLTEYSLPKHAIYAVFSARKHLPTKVSTFIDYLQPHLYRIINK